MDKANTIPVYHHVDNGVFVTCRRPASEGGSLTDKWDETTCPACRDVQIQRRLFNAAIFGLVAVVALIAAVCLIGILHERAACSDAGGAYIRGRCFDRSVLIDP